MLAVQPSPTTLAGRIDAVAVENSLASVVLDWKSDIAPTEEDVRIHAGQLQDYLHVTGAPTRRSDLHDVRRCALGGALCRRDIGQVSYCRHKYV
jgi:hypothetical protein